MLFIAVNGSPESLADPPEKTTAPHAIHQRANGDNPDAFRWCRYPTHPLPVLRDANRISLIAADEVEPNDSIAQAQALPLGTGMGQDVDVTVSGSLATAADIDLYSINILKGDIIGLVCHAQSGSNPVAAMLDSVGTTFFSNDNHGGIATIYPPGSPWPVATSALSAALTFIAPADGLHHIRLTAANSTGTGPYELEIRLRRPAIEGVFPTPLRQILFLDFNGATVNAVVLFGTGRTTATLSPLNSFLAGWGLTAADESAVINSIVNHVELNFDALRLMTLNGDFPTDMMPGHFDLEIRNSRDHPDPFGQPNVSRVIIGGTISQLGISTIGIAEFIDPGNFSQSDSAVVLLDLLSTAASNPNSVNSIPRAGGVSIIDAIGIVVGNIVSHEAGHFLGNWHTRNDNAVNCIMDTGGDILNRAGVGNDGILGTGDDMPGSFQGDDFDPGEGVGNGEERTDVNTAFALATGTLAADMTPPMLQSRAPDQGAMLAALTSVAVTFDEPVTLNAADITVNGSPATTRSGSGAGPITYSGFTPPADGTITIVLGAGGSITDLSGNPLAQSTWTVEQHDCNNNAVPDSADIAAATSRDCPPNGIPDECEPDSLRAQPGSSQTIALGQSIALNPTPAAGGSPPYQFAWSFTGPQTAINTAESAPTFTPSVAGAFTVTLSVTDAVPCTVTVSFNVTVQSTADPGLNNDTTTPPAPCAPLCGPTGASTLLILLITLIARRRDGR